MRLRHTLAAVLLVVTPSVAAAQISGLFNTGVDASGVKLGVNVIDPHYRVLLANTSPQAITTDNPAYVDSPSAQYIWQNADGSPSFATLTFRTTFTVDAGVDPLSVFLTGAWSTDNEGLDILINGASTGLTHNTFLEFRTFSINSGFLSGLNTLDFVVRDLGGPGALTVTDLRGATRVPQTAVPEPSTYVLMAAGLLGVFGFRRRRTA